uniref:Dehydrogenase/reductase (SDR family) member 7Cb n=1 Tax=Salmo trutta TaxID=8032 RepID=A0A673W1Q0_SALTR
MEVPSVIVLPMLIVVAAGIFYIYYQISPRSRTKWRSSLMSRCACLFHKCGAKLILCGASWDNIKFLSCPCFSPPYVIFLCIPLSSAQTFPPKLVLLDFSDMDGMPEVVDEVVDEVVECCGCVDVLLCNSSMKLKAVHTASLELDRNIMDINYQTSCMDVLHCPFQNLLYGLSKLTCLALTLNIIVSIEYAVQAFFYCLQVEVEEYGTLVSTFSHTFINAAAPSKPPAKPHTCLLLSSVGMRLADLANEIILLATPIPRITLYLLSFFPSFFFVTVAGGVKDSVMAEQTLKVGH